MYLQQVFFERPGLNDGRVWPLTLGSVRMWLSTHLWVTGEPMGADVLGVLECSRSWWVSKRFSNRDVL